VFVVAALDTANLESFLWASVDDGVEARGVLS
jgi:hypothetical protein